jgi:bifunctional UDP-N-acetylglucosamine pyrophosphorylase/glucosamine-1-phosphate N-acetyltransferase
VRWVLQEPQLGTAHAVGQAMDGVDADSRVLVLYGDVPLIGVESLHALLAGAGAGRLAVMTARLDRPAGYGRVVRDASDRVVRIVEERDASDAERAIDEINTGFLAVDSGLLRGWLERVGNHNSRGEYYLTDVVALAVADGVAIDSHRVEDSADVLGVNSQAELARAERRWQHRRAAELMAGGLRLMDPERFDLRGELRFGSDCVIDVNVVVEGTVELGDNVRIGANCLLRDVRVGNDVEIKPCSVLEGARLDTGTSAGPFARLRPGTILAEGARVGNFVEVKNSTLGPGSKVNHLSYVGDAEVGRDVNIGAGVITCNYDGARKHRTVIGDGAFIGSDSQLVAPVTVGAGATIGAGSTITRDAPEGQLTLSRAEQKSLAEWRRPSKNRKS